MARATRKRKAPKSYWGYHLIVNAASCNPGAIRSSTTIKGFTKELVKRIDMTAYGPPKVVRFGTGHLMGYSLMQLIETSNITAHFAEESGDAYFDIFSCKTFNPADALAVIREFFHPKAVQSTFLKRQAHL
jgi:S-adenosylmethionine/arginine decarboxylase-like enzyme